MPNDKYSTNTFNVTYSRLDSTEIEGKERDYAQSFILGGLDAGIHYVPSQQVALNW